MPLRHLTLNDPQYVPQYNTLDTNLVAGVAGSIQQQGAQAEQYRMTQMDSFREAIDTTLGGLPEQDRMYAQNVVSDIQGGIDDYVATHGSRRSMDYVGRQTQQFRDRLQPHFQKAGTMAQAHEQLSESEAPSHFKSAIDYGQIKYDEDGNPSYEGMDAENQRRLDIVANYKDPYEKLKEFNSKARKASGTEDLMFTPVTDSKGNVIVNSEGQPTSEYRQKLKSIGFDTIMQDNIAVLLADPQIRRQLELEGQLQLEAAEAQGIETNITVADDGSVKTLIEVPKVSLDGSSYIDEDGNPTQDKSKAAMVEQETPFDSLAHLMAAKQAQPFAMRDSFIDRSFDVRSPSGAGGRGGNNYSDNITLSTKVDFEIEQQSVRDYFTSHFEQKKQIQTSNQHISDEIEEMVQRQMPDSNVKISPTEDGHVTLSINGEKFDNRDPESREKLRNHLGVSYDSVITQLEDISNNYKQAKHLEKTEKDIINYVKNNLVDDESLAEYEKFIIFDTDGSIKLNNEFIREQVRTGDLERKRINVREMSPDKVDTLAERFGITTTLDDSPSRGQGTENERRRQIISQLPDGEIIKLPTTRRGHQVGEQSYIIENGQLFSLHEADSGEVSNIQRIFNRAKDLQQQAVDNYREVGIYETSGRVLNPDDDIDSQIIGMLERVQPGRAGASGEIQDRSIIGGDGNIVEVDYTAGEYFDPIELTNIKGEASIIGVVKNNKDEIIKGKENVRFTGVTADDVLRNVIGENYKDVLGIQQLSSYLHRPVQGERRNNLSVNQISRVLGLNDEHIPYKNGLTVDYRVSYRGDGPPTKKFYVNDPDKGKDIIEAVSYEDLYRKLFLKVNEQI